MYMHLKLPLDFCICILRRRTAGERRRTKSIDRCNAGVVIGRPSRTLPNCDYMNVSLLSFTFMRKNVIEVSRSTVDLRSINFSWDEAGKLFRYIDKSILRELCNWSKSLTNFSFCNNNKKGKNIKYVYCESMIY